MLKFIPIRAQAGIVGFESPATEYKELGLDLDALLIEHPSATYIGLAQGESMIRDGIFDGDLLIVSRAEPITDLCICVANLNGVFVCKRVDIRHRRLLSGCHRTPPYQLTDDDDFQIEGVVIRSIRIHKPLRQAL